MGSLEQFIFPEGDKKVETHVKSIIDEEDEDIATARIKAETRLHLAVWQEFIDETIAHGDKLPSFPVWAMEFGATYDFEDTCPALSVCI